MHELHPGQGTLRRLKRLESEHGTRDLFNRSMVLLDHIIQILHLADDDGGAMLLVVAVDGRRMGLASIDGDGDWEKVGELTWHIG
jgi:hypothetical protein